MRLALLFYALFVILQITPCFASTNTDRYNIHIISSYDPDSRKIASFISTLKKKLKESDIDHSLEIESMNVGTISKSYSWSNKFEKIIQNQTLEETDAIIVIGQEAWNASLSSSNLPPEIPIYAISASVNGLSLSPSKSTDNIYFHPESVNLAQVAKQKHRLYGGCLTEYDIDKNIQLIKKLFPNTKNIAFLSDFTYDGKSIQALAKDSERKFEDLNFTYIDAQQGRVKAQEEIEKLDPSETAILIGAWSIDGEDRHLPYNSLKNMLNSNPTLPVFSVSGTEIGITAIGGYVPDYGTNEEALAQTIIDFNDDPSSNVRFISSKSHYLFNKDLLDQFGIKEYKLPIGSDIYSSVNEAALKYQKYTVAVLCFSIFLIVMFIIITIVLMRITILKNDLEKKSEELIASKEKAEQSDKMKSAFLANMSHEIRTPLNAIVGFSEILCEEQVNEDEAKVFKGIISQNSEMLLSLIDDILDLSRLESSDTKFYKTDFSVNDLCEKAFSSTKINHKLKVEAIYTPDSDDCIINSDYRRITQVLTNLLNNAYKFTDDGYIKLSYFIDKGNNEVYFSVEDTGCGIPRNKHKTIFERFEKGNEFTQGAGLGLAICHNILKKLDSEIWIDSKYTTGTRFVFRHQIKELKEKDI